jgi:hypothetical protein
MAKKYGSEQGSTLAWTALLLALVVVPLLALLANSARLFLIRQEVQTATEAACEDAAWSAADRRTFRDTGTLTFLPAWQVQGFAQATFAASLPPQDKLKYGVAMRVTPDYVNQIVFCRTQVAAERLFARGWTRFTVQAASSIRTR